MSYGRVVSIGVFDEAFTNTAAIYLNIGDESMSVIIFGLH